MSNIEQLLMDKKMKRTKARVLILKTLAKGLPLSAGEVFEAVRVKDTQLSLSTVLKCRLTVSSAAARISSRS